MGSSINLIIPIAGIVAVVALTLPDGEIHKDWETLNRIFDALLENRCERGTALIALGGGVIAPASATGGVNTTSATTP